jgi:hypothetical protein
MLSRARYESEAAMAETGRAAARSDEEAVAYAQMVDHYSTAARHARFHGEWMQRSASERAAARQGPVLFGGRRGPINPVLQAQGLAQADQSAQIAVNHRQAAEDHAAAAEAVRPPPAPPGAPDQSLPPGAPGAPDQSLPLVCNDTPYVSGTGVVGETLSCTMGNWTGSPTSYAYQWLSDGTTPLGTGASYVVVAADAGHSITCTVTASNSLGTATSPPSNAVDVAGGGDDC